MANAHKGASFLDAEIAKARKRRLFDWQAAVASAYGPKSPTCRHVLLTLSLDASAVTLDAFPSIKRLTQRTGLSNRIVIDHLWAAEAEGWFKRSYVKLSRSGGGWRQSTYHLTIPAHVPKAVSERRSLTARPVSEPNDVQSVSQVHTNTVLNSDSAFREEPITTEALEDSGDEKRLAAASIFEGEAPWAD